MSLHRAQVALDVPDSNCLKHGNKLVLHFCKTCGESGCSKCMQTKHKVHDWCDIEDIEDQKQKELEKDVNILENNILPKLNEKREQAVKEVDLDKSEIDRQADAMKTIIDKYRELLKSKVDSTRSSDTGSAAMIADLDRDIADIQQIIRNSKKSIAIQAKSEIVQGSENVKVVIAEVDRSLAEMDRRTVTCFRRGEIDTHVLQRMFGSMESEDALAAVLNDIKLSSPLHDVTVQVKYIIPFGTDIMEVCAVRNEAWIHERFSEKVVRINIHGKHKKYVKIPATPQNISLHKSGKSYIYMCFYDSGWISRLTPDHRVKDIINTMPLRPHGLCVTQSGDILVALVDVQIKDFDKCKQTYIARIDNLCREKQRIQFEKDGQTRLFQYTFYVNENRNGDILVVDMIGEFERRLYISNSKGDIKHSYNGTSQLGQKFNPVSLCCDDQCRIIVADLNNSVLHLLNPRGELLQLLMTEEDGLVHPYSLGLCDGLLWVGTMKGKVIVAEYRQ